jgi:hypothetical protein
VKVEFALRARLDLIEIGDYLERVASKRTALRWLRVWRQRRSAWLSILKQAPKIPTLAVAEGLWCDRTWSSIALRPATLSASFASCMARAICLLFLDKKSTHKRGVFRSLAPSHYPLDPPVRHQPD